MIWPGVLELPEYKKSFPKFRGTDPTKFFKNFDNISLDLILKMIALDPVKRISVKDALKHPYFNDLK